ncbi:MAG TPA: hypothetical protein VGB44_00960 [Flavobacterium sp.]|jgi:hypothetical protein
MNTNVPSTDREIDLSALAGKFTGSRRYVSSFFFRCMRFIVKNIIALIIIIIVGVGLGFYSDKTSQSYVHEIIVTPNFGSVDYLYSKVDLINSKIGEKDTMFLKNLGIKHVTSLRRCKVKPIIDVYRFIENKEYNYKLLSLMAEDGDITKIVEENTTSKNYVYHSITFSTKNKITYEGTIVPFLAFLNDSDYFNQIQKRHLANSNMKVAANEVTIAQIDALLNSFSQSQGNGSNGNLVYINENTQLNDIIKTKEELIEEQGYHRVEAINLSSVIKESSSMLNVRDSSSLNGKMKFILPLLFIFLYILGYLFVSFYRSHASKYNSQPV